MVCKAALADGPTRTSLVLVIVSAMILAAPGSSVTGMKGREDAAEAEGVTADEGVMASSEDVTCPHSPVKSPRKPEHSSEPDGFGSGPEMKPDEPRLAWLGVRIRALPATPISGNGKRLVCKGSHYLSFPLLPRAGTVPFL